MRDDQLAPGEPADRDSSVDAGSATGHECFAIPVFTYETRAELIAWKTRFTVRLLQEMKRQRTEPG